MTGLYRDFPPIWISAVSQRGLSPLTVIAGQLPDNEDPIYRMKLPVGCPEPVLRDEGKLQTLYYPGWESLLVVVFIVSLALFITTIATSMSDPSLGAKNGKGNSLASVGTLLGIPSLTRVRTVDKPIGKTRLNVWCLFVHLLLLYLIWTMAAPLLTIFQEFKISWCVFLLCGILVLLATEAAVLISVKMDDKFKIWRYCGLAALGLMGLGLGLVFWQYSFSIRFWAYLALLSILVVAVSMGGVITELLVCHDIVSLLLTVAILVSAFVRKNQTSFYNGCENVYIVFFAFFAVMAFVLVIVARRKHDKAVKALGSTSTAAAPVNTCVCLFVGFLMWLLSLMCVLFVLLMNELLPVCSSLCFSDGVVAFERTMLLPDGLTPIFPVLFLFIALGYGYYSTARQFYIADKQGKMGEGFARNEELAKGSLQFKEVWNGVREKRRLADDAIKHPTKAVLDKRFLAFSILAGLLFLFGIIPFVHRTCWQCVRQTFEPYCHEAVLVSLLIVTYYSLFFSLTYLLVLWHCIRSVLRGITLLFLDDAFDRLPSSVAGWLNHASRWSQTEREDTIRRHAEAMLADEESLSLRRAVYGIFLEDRFLTEYWEKSVTLWKNKAVAGPREAVDQLRPLLLVLWEGLPAVTARPDRTRSARGVSKSAAEPANDHWSDAPVLRGLSSPEDRETVARWARKIEDLVALQVVRWMVPAVAQLWNQVTFLVIAGIALLLSVTSYPFVSQQRLIWMVGLLLLAIAVAIIYVLLGMNRNEVISRLSNTTPNRLSYDSSTIANLLAYVLPVLGILAAFSLDLGEVLRDWLDPLFRLLD